MVKFATLGSYSFPLSRRFTFKLGKFNFKVLFSAKSRDFRQMILIKTWENRENYANKGR